MIPSADPFADVAALTGVGAAAAHARDAVDALLRHPMVRRDPARLAAASALRGAKASALLAGGTPTAAGDAVTQGAIRATAEAVHLAPAWRQRPGQVLARLHLLAARNSAEPDVLGRPRPESTELASSSSFGSVPVPPPHLVWLLRRWCTAS